MTTIQWIWNYEFFHGAISFTIHTKELPGFRKFLQDIKPDWSKQDSFVKEFWEQAFVCSFPNSSDHMDAYKACTGEENLETLSGPVFEMHILGHSYSIYNAVYAIAHALHAIYVSRFIHREVVCGKRVDLQGIQPWQDKSGSDITPLQKSAHPSTIQQELNGKLDWDDVSSGFTPEIMHTINVTKL
ncbi:UNVERIFIED_CONTAM: hypothetical protein K2H54_044147 [Gekko kuhli]